MKLLITGGAGFIGSNFILYWLKNHPNDEIVNLDVLTYAACLDNLKSVENSSHYHFIKGDICDSHVVNQAMQGIDKVIHFAAQSHVDRSILDPSQFVKTNVLGTQVLLDSALQNKVKRFHHISCYDEKTRAFTKEGLKYYWDLKKTDEVLSLNLETKNIEWKKIEKVIVQDYQGDMVEINSDKLHMKVTPNHRMMLETPITKKIIFKEANKLGTVNHLLKGNWNSNSKINKNFMYLLGFFIGDGTVSYQEKIIPNKTGLNKVEYLAQSRDKTTGKFSVLSNKGIKKSTVCHGYRIFIDVPNKDKGRKKLEKALSELKINWHPHNGKAGQHIFFTSKEISDIFKDCGSGALNKKIPEWALKSNQESLQALFEGLIDADGSWTPNTRLSTSSWKLVETFSELCIKLRLIPHIFVRKPKGNYYQGRMIKGNISYIVTVTKQNRSIRLGKKLNQVKHSFYQGKIWCVKVPDNKNLLVEKEGTFVFCGNTDEVFGALALNTKEKFSEKTNYNPRSPYSASKAGADFLVRAYYHTYGLPVTITNCSNNYGPYQHPEKLIPLAITNSLEGKKVPVYGDGLYIRDWLYVEDHCRAIDLVLNKGKIGETYCVGGLTTDISNLEVVKKILSSLSYSSDKIEFVKDRPGHDRRYAVDWTKIKTELGWQPLFGFDTWLAKTVTWYKENQWWWKPLKGQKFQEYYKKNYNK